MLAKSLELKFLCENIAFVLNNNFEQHNFAQLLIGHKYAHRKSGAFSLDKSIIHLTLAKRSTLRVSFVILARHLIELGMQVLFIY